MNFFVLTGAGVSAESGLGTFRDKDGLWARFDPMKLATPEAFARAPEQVHAFYNMRRENLLQAEPNEAHPALARLERAWWDAAAACSCAPRTLTTCTSGQDRNRSCTCTANC